MSRSLKKTPGWTSTGKSSRRAGKRNANSKVRNTSDIPDGMAYKKVFCSWNIDDYPHVLFTKEAVKAHENRLKRIFEEGTSYYWRTRMKTEKDLKKAIKKPYMK